MPSVEDCIRFSCYSKIKSIYFLISARFICYYFSRTICKDSHLKLDRLFCNSLQNYYLIVIEILISNASFPQTKTVRDRIESVCSFRKYFRKHPNPFASQHVLAASPALLLLLLQLKKRIVRVRSSSSSSSDSDRRRRMPAIRADDAIRALEFLARSLARSVGRAKRLHQQNNRTQLLVVYYYTVVVSPLLNSNGRASGLYSLQRQLRTQRGTRQVSANMCGGFFLYRYFLCKCVVYWFLFAVE